MSLIKTPVNQLIKFLKISVMRHMSLSVVFLLFSIFSFSQSKNIDCHNAIHLCNKDKITIESLKGFGNVKDDLTGLACSGGAFKEKNSIWFKWTVEESGNLTFNITPTQANDDIDFVVFKVNGDDSCQGLESVRCMSSGENLGRATQSDCLGQTGLRKFSTDFNEDTGCHGGDDNYLAPLETEKGETYLLLINNYSSTLGFELGFAGVSEFSSKKCQEEETIKNTLSIGEVFPNPTQEFVNIMLESPETTNATFTIVDIYGKQLSINQKELLEGTHHTTIDVKDLSAGAYFITIQVGEKSIVKKFIKI